MIGRTDHVGTHDSGWKSEIDRHSRLSVSKRPLGVTVWSLDALNTDTS